MDKTRKQKNQVKQPDSLIIKVDPVPIERKCLMPSLLESKCEHIYPFKNKTKHIYPCIQPGSIMFKAKSQTP